MPLNCTHDDDVTLIETLEKYNAKRTWRRASKITLSSKIISPGGHRNRLFDTNNSNPI